MSFGGKDLNEFHSYHVFLLTIPMNNNPRLSQMYYFFFLTLKLFFFFFNPCGSVHVTDLNRFHRTCPPNLDQPLPQPISPSMPSKSGPTPWKPFTDVELGLPPGIKLMHPESKTPLHFPRIEPTTEGKVGNVFYHYTNHLSGKT